MAKRTVLVVATSSHAGKSTVVTGLCRLLSRNNISVAPFKGQNMSNNARAVPSTTSDNGWGEIGISQYVQARAAGITPNTDMNPVLLKPRGDGESQLILSGNPIDHYQATKYYETHWAKAREEAENAYKRLSKKHDVIICEGAGSIGEINLHHRDIANIETARYTNADIILISDIERGGAFASLYGTIELLPKDIKQKVTGFIITKFRGQKEILEPGIEKLEEITGIPVLGVIPYDDPELPEEDSVSLPPKNKKTSFGEDNTPPHQTINIGIIRLPHISNFTDFQPLQQKPGTKITYLPINQKIPKDIDALIIPGTKNTVNDLQTIKKTGLTQEIKKFNKPIIGVCGGYQMLGMQITNADIEGTDNKKTIEGLKLLPTKTEFKPEKKVNEVEIEVNINKGLLKGTKDTIHGYEIHMGRTKHLKPLHQPLEPGSAEHNNVLGTYIHGLFENQKITNTLINQIYKKTNKPKPKQTKKTKNPLDKAADLIQHNTKIEKIFPKLKNQIKSNNKKTKPR
ncbi:Cobyric acid synthase CobQ [Methanonatronarchaeum thermophilum]|uniref:Probable cobyric acid synthase n=1 Tax=Methanonatronarchaeum thermophilum TaxID=1927129 RepID=A0A1Y3G9X3_9EURY|nr:cobyric acid synthase [Methanonatronarchaeum thermophilum]OUJ18242.1 Cobyric acid synthase CobQ [Methanonatronarchaeum thermophilum]